MNPRLTSVLSFRRALPLALLFSASAFAAPSDDLTAAAKKLADASNYAWTTTTEMGDNSFPVDGVTEKGGYTVITRSFNGNSTQTVRKGTEVVTQNRDGDWMSAEEQRAQFAQRGGGGGGKGGGGGGGGAGRGFGGGMFGGGGGAAIPAEALANYAAKVKDIKVEEGALVVTAKDEEAAALMMPVGGARGGRGGQGGGGGGGGQGGDQGKRGGGFAAPKVSSVTLKFWLKDGAITKYSVHSLSSVNFNGEERDFDTTSTTEIKNVGTAKVEVPEAAKKKFAP